MAKIHAIGIIAEDDSDFETIKILISRITKKNLTFKKFTSGGCGKLRRKCRDYAVTLEVKGCNLLIIVHDLDRNKHVSLKAQLEQILRPSPIKEYLICIPVEEIEAWFLSDPATIKKIYSLSKPPTMKGLPETISSPKEELGRLVKVYSNKQKEYLNTKHNLIIAEQINMDLINQKCPSFQLLYNFIESHQYK